MSETSIHFGRLILEMTEYSLFNLIMLTFF